MNDTDNIIKSLLLDIQLQLAVLHANQEQIKIDINSFGNEIMIKGSPKQNLSLFINSKSWNQSYSIQKSNTQCYKLVLITAESENAIKIGHPLQESVISEKTVKGGNFAIMSYPIKTMIKILTLPKSHYTAVNAQEDVTMHNEVLRLTIFRFYRFIKIMSVTQILERLYFLVDSKVLAKIEAYLPENKTKNTTIRK
ncbi:hypothetical protein PHYBLDRAFT_166903 [Phycomyces blakesleeanus NRRL 1555(-)]|uniref:Uncharacterized protein n=1 Tax=Phycomyces blakesleeanus (strain ATCC 8743b / DSM 1359 / FGSC 10004 / NBRC 33097 / NRRL 1555) TaxID=763407 RepID=A0A162PSX1_PHYB8|nr:hypothetical protein PHYBLDRAFT_166903 [Phycomyces blakesleeanus NRRL 1555(-)]OAD75677.1 hypothetical protein PHYBLDRAFT_166903 [Phycomyces blakesleeanus NRRL 1555(-)]|eukprot:XP_018293717.1 hypothetical protein PHYBLDRAFT_166903 [Phycomyces blakesleeanus NRRL 1555(-)]